MFEEGSRIITNVADFEFATCFQSHKDRISMSDIAILDLEMYRIITTGLLDLNKLSK